MNRLRPLLGLVALARALSAAQTEVSFQTVALSGQPAPGLSASIHFSSFSDVSVADDGRIAFTANVSGLGVTSTNKLGIWGGLPGELRLVSRTGDPMPGSTNGGTIRHLFKPNIDEHESVGFGAYDEDVEAQYFGKLGAALIGGVVDIEPRIYRYRVTPIPHFNEVIPALAELLGFVVNTTAGRAILSGSEVGPTNNIAIVAGPPTNGVIVARTGFSAPGATGNFTSISDLAGAVALMPNGKVAFVASTAVDSGIWLGNGDGVQGVALFGKPAPVSLLGAGYTFGFQRGENLEVNGRGELAFSTFLNGPGLNSTNSEFVVAGAPNSLRIIAQAGQPAPGIPGTFFRRFDGGSSSFSHVLLGADGAVVFVGCYSSTGKDFGLWLAPTNGSTPLLLMRTGQQAPGAPLGVVFEDTSIYVPPFRQAFMNSRNQVVFRARLGGPGVGPFSFGIWLAEPEGSVGLLARSGDMIDGGDGIVRQVDNVTFGTDPVFMAGPEDGRRSPFNDRGEVALLAYFTASSGVLIAHSGIYLGVDRSGNDVRVTLPTLAGRTYRVEYSTNLSATSWSVLQNSIAGTGSEVTVTDTNAVALDRRFYRGVRMD